MMKKIDLSKIPTIEDCIGNTPLVRLQRINPNPSNVILTKLEGDNPAGSVKDRPVLSMVLEAEKRGDIKPGDTLVEPTSGNTGIALASIGAIKGYKVILVMPEDSTQERIDIMRAYGAEVILCEAKNGMERAIDIANEIEASGKAKKLNQFANKDNPKAHITTTGPEIWQQTDGKVTHFISAMGTTGTITGVSTFLKKENPSIQIIGAQPTDNARIPGIRKWPEEYMPKIYEKWRVDELVMVSPEQAEWAMKELASKEGILVGPSSGGATYIALELSKKVKDAVIVTILCDRGDRYVSSGIYR